MDQPANAKALAGRTAFAPALGLALEVRTDPLAPSNNDNARVVLAAHTLLHVLGHMLCNASGASLGGRGAAASAGPAVVQGPAGSLVDGPGQVVLQQGGSGAAEPQAAVYISLATAAKAVGVQLPQVTTVVGKHGEPALRPDEAAELR
jgi:hypothetical protein